MLNHNFRLLPYSAFAKSCLHAPFLVAGNFTFNLSRSLKRHRFLCGEQDLSQTARSTLQRAKQLLPAWKDKCTRHKTPTSMVSWRTFMQATPHVWTRPNVTIIMTPSHDGQPATADSHFLSVMTARHLAEKHPSARADLLVLAEALQNHESSQQPFHRSRSEIIAHKKQQLLEKDSIIRDLNRQLKSHQLANQRIIVQVVSDAKAEVVRNVEDQVNARVNAINENYVTLRYENAVLLATVNKLRHKLRQCVNGGTGSGDQHTGDTTHAEAEIVGLEEFQQLSRDQMIGIESGNLTQWCDSLLDIADNGSERESGEHSTAEPSSRHDAPRSLAESSPVRDVSPSTPAQVCLSYPQNQIREDGAIYLMPSPPAPDQSPYVSP